MGGCVGVSCCQPPECCLRACISGFAALSFLPQGKEYHVDYDGVGSRKSLQSDTTDCPSDLSPSRSVSSVLGDSPIGEQDVEQGDGWMLSKESSPKLRADSGEAAGTSTARACRKKKTVSWDEEDLDIQRVPGASPPKALTTPAPEPARIQTDPTLAETE